MNKRLFGIGTAVMAVALTAGMTASQLAGDTDDQVQSRVRAQGVQPPAGQGRGQMGQGQMGQGQMGQGQGQRPGARGALGPGQGLGRGIGQGRGAGVGGPGAGRGLMLGARLDLTDDQQTQVQALQRANRDGASAIQDELELARRALHRETFADTRDNAKITALAAKVSTLEKQLFDSHLKTQVAIADLLTPAQRETMRLSGGGRGRGAGAPRR